MTLPKNTKEQRELKYTDILLCLKLIETFITNFASEIMLTKTSGMYMCYRMLLTIAWLQHYRPVLFIREMEQFHAHRQT